MKTKQVNPMPAFIDVGFDIEWNTTDCAPLFRSRWQIIPNCTYKNEDVRVLGGGYFFRPRLNNPQVLSDWSFIPQGFAVRYLPDGTNLSNNPEALVDSAIVANFAKGFTRAVEILGVIEGSQLEDWAIENDVPIYNDDMEVAK